MATFARKAEFVVPRVQTAFLNPMMRRSQASFFLRCWAMSTEKMLFLYNWQRNLLFPEWPRRTPMQFLDPFSRLFGAALQRLKTTRTAASSRYGTPSCFVHCWLYFCTNTFVAIRPLKPRVHPSLLTGVLGKRDPRAGPLGNVR